MIDCLSNPEWINPQINFLLFLQNFRVGNLEIFDKFFLSITIFGEYWIPTIICSIIYWCIDSKAGMYLFSLEGFNVMLSHLFKMLACVYRPWVLDNRIHPSELAVPYAKGYSFPSGHTSMSSSVFGGIAFLNRKNITRVILLIFLICLVGFSRLWLGVHTPQDVLGGLLIGITLILGVNPLIEWAEKDKNRYLYLAGIVDILAILSLIYISFLATYRMDYVSGELLVNPQKSIYLTIIIFGYALGLVNGCFLCRKFLPFDPKTSSVKERIIRGIVGTICVTILIKTVLEYIFLNIIDIKIALSMTFIVGIFITLIYPIIFTKLKIKEGN